MYLNRKIKHTKRISRIFFKKKKEKKIYSFFREIYSHESLSLSNMTLPLRLSSIQIISTSFGKYKFQTLNELRESKFVDKFITSSLPFFQTS